MVETVEAGQFNDLYITEIAACGLILQASKVEAAIAGLIGSPVELLGSK